MEHDKEAFRRYYPNSTISDSDLISAISEFHKINPNTDFESFLKEKRATWYDFKGHYPNADFDDFVAKNVDGMYGVYRKGTDFLVWGQRKGEPHNHPLSEAIRDALGNNVSFPGSLLALGSSEYPTVGTPYPIMAFPWGSGLGKTTPLSSLKIHVSPNKSFHCKLRDVFDETTVVFRSAKQSHRWLSGPNL